MTATRSGVTPPTSTSSRSRLATPWTITRSQLAYSSAQSGAASRERRGSTSCAVKIVAPAACPAARRARRSSAGCGAHCQCTMSGCWARARRTSRASPSACPAALSGMRAGDEGRRAIRPASGGPKISWRA